MVQDPNFWRRFSVAVHNDEAAILAKDLESSSGGGTRKQETKHAYVVSLSSPIDSPTSAISSTPNSTSHLSPAFPPAGFHAPPKMPAVAFARPLSAPTLALARGDTSPCSEREREQQRKSLAAGSGGRRSVMFASEDKPFETVIALHKFPSQPQPTHNPSTPKSLTFNLSATPSLSNPSPSSKRSSKRTSRFRFPRPTKSLPLRSHPPTQPSTPLSASFAGSKTSLPIPSSTHRASWRWSRLKQPNGSRLSLGVSLSGRPKSAFRFWTTITADAGNDRDSWLEGQQRKAKHRTYMCWAFWMTFLVVVVGGVVAVLVLKGKGII